MTARSSDPKAAFSSDLTVKKATREGNIITLEVGLNQPKTEDETSLLECAFDRSVSFDERLEIEKSFRKHGPSNFVAKLPESHNDRCEAMFSKAIYLAKLGKLDEQLKLGLPSSWQQQLPIPTSTSQERKRKHVEQALRSSSGEASSSNRGQRQENTDMVKQLREELADTMAALERAETDMSATQEQYEQLDVENTELRAQRQRYVVRLERFRNRAQDLVNQGKLSEADLSYLLGYS